MGSSNPRYNQISQIRIYAWNDNLLSLYTKKCVVMVSAGEKRDLSLAQVFTNSIFVFLSISFPHHPYHPHATFALSCHLFPMDDNHPVPLKSSLFDDDQNVRPLLLCRRWTRAETMAVLSDRVTAPETQPNPEDAMANKTAWLR